MNQYIMNGFEFFIGIGLFLVWLFIYLLLIDPALRRIIGKRYGILIKREISQASMNFGWTVVDTQGKPVAHPPNRALTQWLGFWLFWFSTLAMASLLIGGTFWMMR